MSGCDLAHAAAELALLDRVVEEVHAVLADHRGHRRAVRHEHLDALVVALAHAVDQVVRRLRQPPGVEHEHARLRIDPVHHVEQHQALGRAERARERDPRAEILERPSEDLLGAPRLRLARANHAQKLVRQRLRAIWRHRVPAGIGETVSELEVFSNKSLAIELGGIVAIRARGWNWPARLSRARTARAARRTGSSLSQQLLDRRRPCPPCAPRGRGDRRS